MFLQRKIIIWILKLLGLSVRKTAIKSPAGFEGSFSFIFKLFPLIGLALFCWAGIIVISDPDEYYIAIIPFGLAVVFIGILIHRTTFKIVYTMKQLQAESRLYSLRVIHLNRPFQIEMDEETKTMKVSQDGVKIDIPSTLNGHQDFFDEAFRQYKILNKEMDYQRVSSGVSDENFVL